GRFATELFTRQSRQLGILQQRLRDVVYERGDARILRYFEALALQIGVESPEGVFIDSRVTHQTIADTCGLARETVSRLLTNLKQRGQLFRTADGWVLNVKGSVRAEQC
ncbi:MAG: Crp/Fnr family transcriptional regulator, partial [Planctomycetaceae bacterium]|nr:Crp/Fnr family transcriptional regulator [Planctomycetaceae bacterium]